jgi:5-methylcytosine-specific restriction endonuclease McrA
MRNRYRLGGLANDELLAALSALVQREHELLSDFLAHLAELDERRLFLDLGFTSLFSYCTEALGLSRSSAGRRIAAARVCRRFPEALALAARGELELSVLCELSKYLNSENATELFEACRGKSYELVLALLAARFPKPDVRDSVRRLPARSPEVTPNVGCEPHSQTSVNSAKGADPLAAADGASTAKVLNSPAIAAAAPRPTAPVRRALEPLSADRFGVRFTADAEFCELLEEVRALASYREPGGDLLSLMKRGLASYRRELQNERFGVGRRPRLARSQRTESAEAAGYRSRNIPAAVARQVYIRDGGCCTFCSEDGRRCGARRFLELDHVTPWAARGESTIENLRLRCRAHNQHAARSYFGAELVRARVASRPSASTSGELTARSEQHPQIRPNES